MHKVVRGQLRPYLPKDVRDDYGREAWDMDSKSVVPVLTMSMMGWTKIFAAVDPAPEAKSSFDPWPHSPLRNSRAQALSQDGAQVSPRQGR